MVFKTRDFLILTIYKKKFMNQLLTWAVECKFTFKSQPLGQALHYFFNDLKYRQIWQRPLQNDCARDSFGWNILVFRNTWLWCFILFFFSFEFAKMNFDQKTLIDSSAQVSLNCRTTEQQASKHSGQDIFTIRCIALRFYIR